MPPRKVVPVKNAGRTSSFANLELAGSEKVKTKQHGKRPAKSKVMAGVKKEVATKKGNYDLFKTEKPKYDKDAMKKFDDMLDGILTNLPPQPKTMVKIFLSSTFSDMREERNILAREVYPYLRAYCASLGLDFQVVDMRWGITDDSINDHSVEKLCLLEVANCQKTSIGPNFIVLSGQRYGFRPLPTEITVERFELLHSIAQQLKLENRELLHEWYKLDENMVPPMYILQPIKTKFTFYGDYSPGCDDLRQKDTADWWKTFESLQGCIRKAATYAFEKKKITDSELHEYFLSVTECEIKDGILDAKDVDAHCLVYNRTLTRVDQTGINDNVTHRFLDVIQNKEDGRSLNEVNKEVEQLRNSLREKVKSCLPDTNKKDYCVHWMPKGLSADITEHLQYLKGFCADFIEDCTRLIEKAETEKGTLIDTRNYYSYYDETIHHLKFCQSKCESFCGQEMVLAAAKKYILNKTGRRPLIIHAESGLGKTSIMAMIMKSIPEWLENQSHCKMIRFLGTTPQTNNIFDVLYGVLGQLSDAYDQIMPPHYYSSMKKMMECTPSYIRHISKQAKEPVIILLDSVDQLYPHNNAYSMEWLPLMLPTNIKIIISTLPKECDILKNLKKLLPDPECYVEVPKLNEPTAVKIVDTYLQRCGRTLQPFQKSLLLSVFKGSQNPLFLKLLIDEAKIWKSYTEQASLTLPQTVRAAINKLFEKLENKFGYILVSHALGYITIGLIGLTEFEIEDVLSCDDEVLNEVYKYHDPPVPGIVRIPPVLWARIRYDIEDYLAERMSLGKHTLYWYHRQFIETAQERYTSEGKNAVLHNNLATIYMQENGVQSTITLHNRKNLVVENANRQVTPQPFSVNNKRKLACLPFHAIHGFKLIGLDKAKSNVFCNFKYLCNRIAAFSVAVVINDLSTFVEESQDEEVKILLDFFTSCKVNFSQQTYFAFFLLAHINPKPEHKHLRELLAEAKEFIYNKKKPILIPEFSFLASRTDISGACQMSAQGFTNIVTSSNSGVLLKREIDKDSEDTNTSEEAKPAVEYGVWSAESFEVTYIDVTNMNGSLEKCILGNENLLYINKSSLVNYNINNQDSKNLELSLIKALNISRGVVDFVANSERNIVFIATKDAIARVDVLDWSIVDTFLCSGKQIVIENISVLQNGEKCLAIGVVKNSEEGDQSQGPDNQSFVAVFEAGKEDAVGFWTTDKKFDSNTFTTAFTDQVLFISERLESVDPAPSEEGDQKKNDESTNKGKLLIFNLDESESTVKELEVADTVSQIEGHPGEIKVAIRTRNGSVFSINYVVASSMELIEQIKVDFAVTEMAVVWEKDLVFLSSVGSNVVVYNLESRNKVSGFTAHPDNIQGIAMVDQFFITIGANTEMKVWSVNKLIKNSVVDNTLLDLGLGDCNVQLLEQVDVTAVACSADSDKLYTCHECGMVKIWKLATLEYLFAYEIQIPANLIHVMSHNVVAFHCTSQGMMVILDISTGEEVVKIPSTIMNILHSTISSNKELLYLLSAPKKGREQIDVISISLKTVSKTIHLQSGLTYTDISIFLLTNQRYLVIRHKITEKEYTQIQAMWKTGGFSTQNHRYRFTAVDLSQGSGALIPCSRNMSKIPTLGLFAQAYQGNSVLIASRRYLMVWDIPTGRCDQKPSKERQIGMFYRPHYCGKNCVGGTSYFIQSTNQKFVASGSEDGYMIVYGSETGIPRGSVKPSTKHNSVVNVIAISPDNQWIVSACKNNIMKLWDSATGTEQFSFRLDSEIHSVKFSPNSEFLVFYTGTMASRVGVFSVYSGKRKTCEDEGGQ
ncbi:NACHT domain- and WD repeat-containing protein 1 [Mactra antiquata]